ncbi:MAG: WD40-repeat-containing domain protein [Monoraphidium minutum]|nr:MAG: WD40-repeat-containing domain protein [Monoraphidium minutum]
MGSIQWSCKNWDSGAFLRQAAAGARERHAVIYACAFLPDGGGGGQLLAAGYSSGAIRVFDCKLASELWLSSRQAVRPSLQWHAHDGGVYGLSVAGEGASVVLLSVGDDGRLCGWSAAAVRAAAEAAAQRGAEAAEAPGRGGGGAAAGAAAAAAGEEGPAPLFEVAMPRTDPPFPIASSAHPAAQAVAVDAAGRGGGGGAVYVGASDGGLHVLDLSRLSGGGGGGGGGGVVASLTGHAAAVLGLDCCAATGQVATASEDATVRVWDARASRACTSAIDACSGAALPPGSRPDALRCLRSPHASCVRFDAAGGWLVAGGGNGSLTMWSLGLNALAKQLDTGGCVPQALHMLPGEILMVGSDARLHRFRFSLDSESSADLGCGPAFAVDAAPGGGAVAAGGAGGGALLSPYGTRLGRIAA